ncbi:phage Gp37Gp68 [Roseibium sp. TrichSKD4]|uniref:DUF5131 family protein n=1 Tax=Roseibium sp. TrichSKD4 TaxID=744980 RepID=UPI0001E5629A|nr:DUF5131 family protein [Roseibium sp. TrichSKD4]EFO33814.1 phage Gp37Gp68 [Roseibium sp. TrichSKD4]
MRVPAQVRFVSVEPLLSPVNLISNFGGTLWMGGQRGCVGNNQHNGRVGDVVHGLVHATDPRMPHHHHDDRCKPGLDWVIVGGETGKGARPMHPGWVRSIRDQCAAAGVPFFFKQWCDWLPWEPEYGPCWKSQNGKSEDRHVLFPSDIDNDPKWNDGLSFINEGLDHAAFQKVGKKTAGRMLDGVIHDGYPLSFAA